MLNRHHCLSTALLLAVVVTTTSTTSADVGVGAKPIAGAKVIFDGSRKMLDENWTYWKGPRFSSSLPIKWKIVDDPVDKGTVVVTDDPAAAGGKWPRWRKLKQPRPQLHPVLPRLAVVLPRLAVVLPRLPLAVAVVAPPHQHQHQRNK